MANRLKIEGLDEFTQLPHRLRAKANVIVRAHAERARQRVKDAYPRITGTLQDGVTMTELATGDLFTTAFVVKSTAEYAAAYEFGTKAMKVRRTRPTFFPITTEERRLKTQAVADMLRAEGFLVTGEDA